MALTTRDTFLKDLLESSCELSVLSFNVCKDFKIQVNECLQPLNKEVNERSNIDGFDFLTEKNNLALRMTI
jgi:hypothetical protein